MRQRMAEAAVRESEERFRIMADTAPAERSSVRTGTVLVVEDQELLRLVHLKGAHKERLFSDEGERRICPNGSDSHTHRRH